MVCKNAIILYYYVHYHRLLIYDLLHCLLHQVWNVQFSRLCKYCNLGGSCLLFYEFWVYQTLTTLVWLLWMGDCNIKLCKFSWQSKSSHMSGSYKANQICQLPVFSLFLDRYNFVVYFILLHLYFIQSILSWWWGCWRRSKYDETTQTFTS